MRTPTIRDVAPYFEQLLPDFRTYISTVSHPAHAMSLESAATLWWYCVEVDAWSVCDLGSGFSSYVLRRYATEATHEVFVSSVDTDPEWLQRTSQFVTDHGLDSGELVMFDDWLKGELPFDVIFHDIASGEAREAATWDAAGRLAEGGVLMLDDAHHQSHVAAMRRVANDHSLTLRDIRDVTVDGLGRFALVATTEPYDLADEYGRLCRTPSDIYEHLPTMVQLVNAHDAEHVIELGTRTGVSTIAWLHALAGRGRLTSVDLDERPPIGEFDHWTFIQGDDLDPAIYAELEPADIVFIDTSHALEQTRRELALYKWLVKPGGVIVLHDTQLARPEDSPASDGMYPVKRAVEEFVAVEGRTWVNHTNCNGLGIIQL